MDEGGFVNWGDGMKAPTGPIVVGTDGSDTATAAVIEAARLAHAFDATLHIVSAYEPARVHTEGLPQEFSGMVSSHSQVDSLLADIASRARSAGIRVQTHAAAGDPADTIIEVAREVEARLVVVGNKGIGQLRRFVLGNVPSKVVHNSPCSTYVVHTTAG